MVGLSKHCPHPQAQNLLHISDYSLPWSDNFTEPYMKTIYLHIGTHKTGTTAIQMFATRNASELERRGYFYPQIGRPFISGIAHGHHLFPWCIVNHPVPKRYWMDLAQDKKSVFEHLFKAIELNTCDKIILSSEEFDVFSTSHIESLKSLLASFDVKVIAYLRRKDLYVESMYQTMVVYNDESRQLNEVLNQGFRSPLNYFDFLDGWRRVFGHENVIIRLYCPESLELGDAVSDFYNIIGVDIKDLRDSDDLLKINSSVPLHYVAVIAMLRRSGAHPEVIKACSRIAQKMRGRSPSGFHFLPENERRNLADSGLSEMKRLKILPDDDPVWSQFAFNFHQEKAFYKNNKFEGIGRILFDFKELLDLQNEKAP